MGGGVIRKPGTSRRVREGVQETRRAFVHAAAFRPAASGGYDRACGSRSLKQGKFEDWSLDVKAHAPLDEAY